MCVYVHDHVHVCAFVYVCANNIVQYTINVHIYIHIEFHCGGIPG